MIPAAQIQQWTAHAPWPDPRQVEQDLIISRALCDLFSNDRLKNKIAFRGGTAINKLLFSMPLRYSWKSSKAIVEEIRKSKIPALLAGIYE